MEGQRSGKIPSSTVLNYWPQITWSIGRVAEKFHEKIAKYAKNRLSGDFDCEGFFMDNDFFVKKMRILC